METENSPIYKLLQKLVAEEKLDPDLAKKLLEEILKIIARYREK